MRQTVHLGMRLQPGGQIRSLSPRDQQARVQPRQRCDARLRIMHVDVSGFVIFIIFYDAIYSAAISAWQRPESGAVSSHCADCRPAAAPLSAKEAGQRWTGATKRS